MDTGTRQTSVPPSSKGWLRLINGEDSGGTGQNMPPNYANKWRNPAVIAGGNLEVRSRLQSRVEEGGCHCSGLSRGGRKDSSLINPHLLTAESSPFSSHIKEQNEVEHKEEKMKEELLLLHPLPTYSSFT